MEPNAMEGNGKENMMHDNYGVQGSNHVHTWYALGHVGPGEVRPPPRYETVWL